MKIEKLSAYVDSINAFHDKRSTSIWYASKFYHLHFFSSAEKGKIMRNIAKEICEKEYNITEFDNILFKTSMSNGNIRDNWLWEQIRPIGDYKAIIFVGINPDDISLFFATRDTLDKHLFTDLSKTQHDRNTFWIYYKDAVNFLRPIQEMSAKIQ